MECPEPPDARVTVDSAELSEPRENRADLASQAEPVLTELTASPDVTEPREKLVCTAARDPKDPPGTREPPETLDSRASPEAREPP